MTLWLRIPVLVRSILAGLVVGAAGTLPWAWLVGKNIQHASTWPWAVPINGLILVVWWRVFVRGRAGARANRVPDDLLMPALGAGMLGLIAVLLLQGVLARLVTLPQQRDIDPSRFPMATVFAWVVMSAIVAGVTEETAFRGYMQGGIERRHGVAAAILVSGSFFGLMHFTHPEVGLALLPFYIAVSAVYGLLAAATNSTYPGMVLHVFGNVFSALSLFTTGRSEWQMTTTPAPTIWQTGVDASFVASLVGFLVAGTIAGFAYRALFHARVEAATTASSSRRT